MKTALSFFGLLFVTAAIGRRRKIVHGAPFTVVASAAHPIAGSAPMSNV
jgi:hypothetical protein